MAILRTILTKLLIALGALLWIGLAGLFYLIVFLLAAELLGG